MNNQEDQKLLLLMNKSIEGFERAKLDLDSLLLITNRLEDLLSNLENASNEWRENFRTQWWELELISAVLHDIDESDISKEGREIISQAIKQMKIMIEEESNRQSRTEKKPRP